MKTVLNKFSICSPGRIDTMYTRRLLKFWDRRGRAEKRGGEGGWRERKRDKMEKMNMKGEGETGNRDREVG